MRILTVCLTTSSILVDVAEVRGLLTVFLNGRDERRASGSFFLLLLHDLGGRVIWSLGIRARQMIEAVSTVPRCEELLSVEWAAERLSMGGVGNSMTKVFVNKQIIEVAEILLQALSH
jgi:hypothetical protein